MLTLFIKASYNYCCAIPKINIKKNNVFSTSESQSVAFFYIVYIED